MSRHLHEHSQADHERIAAAEAAGTVRFAMTAL